MEFKYWHEKSGKGGYPHTELDSAIIYLLITRTKE
jgi:hypothetical protein